MKEPKKCIVEGCKGYAFSKGKCVYHAKMHYKPLRRTPLKKGGTRIARRTKSRQYEEDTLYKETKETRKRILISQKRWICLFCGNTLPQCPTWHHAKGRDGDLLFESKFLYPAHFKCHVMEYHGLPINKLSWWDDYIERIKEWDPELYKKELIKIDKANG